MKPSFVLMFVAAGAAVFVSTAHASGYTAEPVPLDNAYALGATGVVVGSNAGAPASFVDGKTTIYKSADGQAVTGAVEAISPGGIMAGVINGADKKQVFMFWFEGKAEALPLPADLSYPSVKGVSDHSNLVGWEYGKPFLYNPGAGFTVMKDTPFKEIHALNGVGGMAGVLGVPGNGGILSTTLEHGFIAAGGTTKDVGDPPLNADLPESEVHDLNDAGVGAGMALKYLLKWSSTDHDDTRRAVRWTNSKMEDLGTLGGPWSEARAINNKGQIVGWADTDHEKKRAFLYEDSKLIDLNTLLTGAVKPRLTDALDINETGDILAKGVLNGVRGYYLLKAAATP